MLDFEHALKSAKQILSSQKIKFLDKKSYDVIGL